MKKIIVIFNSAGKIAKLKKIMKKVYSTNNDTIAEITKFNTGKELIPERVERIEIEIKKVIGNDTVITIPKESLTFLTPEPPHTLIDNTTEVKDRYIVLPWNIRTQAGREELKNLIGKISTSTTNLKYTVFVNNAANNGDESASVADFNLSEVSAEDNVEELLNRIQELEARLRELERKLTEANAEIIRQQSIVQQKDNHINGLNSQINNLNSQLNQNQQQLNSLNNQISSLQNTNYSQSTQLIQFNSNRNIIKATCNAASTKVYQLTNYTGRVTASARSHDGQNQITVTHANSRVSSFVFFVDVNFS